MLDSKLELNIVQRDGIRSLTSLRFASDQLAGAETDTEGGRWLTRSREGYATIGCPEDTPPMRQPARLNRK